MNQLEQLADFTVGSIIPDELRAVMVANGLESCLDDPVIVPVVA